MTRPLQLLALLVIGGAFSAVRFLNAQQVLMAPAAMDQRAAPPAGWETDLLVALGNAQPAAETVAYLDAWHQAEGGTASYNWLNTTQEAPGATCYNADPCVKNYPTYAAGIQATVETLQANEPGYADILAGLQTNDLDRAQRGLAASPWGSSAALVQQVIDEQPITVVVGAKYQVTPTMEVGAYFDTRDCGSWGFQANCQHWGTDYLCPEGCPVTAPFDLTIIALGDYPPGPTMGQYVQGTFTDGYVLYLGHLEGRQAMSVGDTLPAGTLLGFTNSLDHTHVQLAPPGNTGACAQDGSCLDFEQYWEAH